MRHSLKRAFSLVELSIVLVILGLLVGGVLSGQSLIRAAEIRAATSEYSRFLAATQSFRDKYFALPGDMTNATAFWGAAHATPVTCLTTLGTGTQTCNGNGDGQIARNEPLGNHEFFRFWQHLANAGLIEGNYTGIPASGFAGSSTANSPRSRVPSGFWFTAHAGTMSGGTDVFDGNFGNTWELGVITPNFHPSSPLFKPEELWNIDVKVDDGLPARGNLTARAPFNNTCTSAANSADLSATYLLTSATTACVAYFRNLF